MLCLRPARNVRDAVSNLPGAHRSVEVVWNVLHGMVVNEHMI
jgi:hypothetical protein